MTNKQTNNLIQSAEATAILTYGLRGFPLSVKENVGIVP